MTRALFGLLLVSLLGACGAIPKVTTVTLAGTILDGQTNLPLANALVAVYDGPDSSSVTLTRLGDANFLYGIATDSHGQFQLTVPVSTYSIRVFAKGYHCGDSTASGNTEVALLPNGASDVLPTIADPIFTPARVTPQDATVFNATVSGGDPNNWLSHKVFLFEPLTHLVKALDAPSDMTEQGWPDGVWQAQLKAPANTGALIFTLAAATQQCVCAFATAQLLIAR